MAQRWEVGSEFDWLSDVLLLSGENTLLPEPYELFSTGTAALLSIHSLLARNKGQRLKLHLPSFYCMDVAAKLKSVFDLCWYRDLPTQKQPDFNSLNTSPGDLVLAVNLFGIREGKVWQDWLLQHDGVILIEDHSHDPFSVWAQQSIAHYAFASLRKTLPIPDGANIWSPQKMKLPKAASLESFGAYKRLTAMLLKRAYLSGVNISKDVYRRLDIESQEALGNDEKSAVSDFTASILSSLNITEFRRKREANIRKFISLVLDENNPNWKPLFSSWSSDAVPFNSIIVCKNQVIRDSLRTYLISQNIFAAIHWPQPHKGMCSNDSLAIDLSNRILTIPTDQRYDSDDIARVAEILLNFSKHISDTDRPQIEDGYRHLSGHRLA